MSQLTPGTENRALLNYLNTQREHVLGILEGLDDEALRRTLLTSGWSCLGMVQHLALDVERFWFQAVVAGEQPAIASLDETTNAWQVGEDVPVQSVIDLYRQEIERSNVIISAASPDAPPTWWPEALFGDWRIESVREIILHVMTETATHAGHLDIVREQIDGRLWFVLA